MFRNSSAKSSTIDPSTLTRLVKALKKTAAGLAAAIPAAVFFNFYSSRIKVLTAMMDDFAMEFLNIVERNFT